MSSKRSTHAQESTDSTISDGYISLPGEWNGLDIRDPPAADK
jgi:hypothetical protein